MKLCADSHTHILSERLFDQAECIVKKLKNDGIEFIVEIGCDPIDARRAVDFAKTHDNVYCAVGVHPHYAGEYSDEFENWVRSLATTKQARQIVALGECGLDYHHNLSPRDIQRNVFIKQIKLAHELSLPLIVHSRDAFDDTYKLLTEHKDLLTNGVVMHCYSYGAVEVKHLSELNCYFSFSGAITYAKSYASIEDAVAAVKAVPPSRLMVETDCPYLAPVPVRGCVNQPKNVRYVIECVARMLGKSADEIAELTLQNTKRVFRI